MAASVTIAGVGGTVNVEVDEDSTVASVLQSALDVLGVGDNAVDKLAAVVDGEDADMQDPVADGVAVAAAPHVANG